MSDQLLLSIEAGVAGGSIALSRDGEVIDSWRGRGDISRAEDLLSNISTVLQANDSTLADVKTLAVSLGPGSYTGIRIGISTALGLRSALGAEVVGISVLEAMAVDHLLRPVICAVGMGRTGVCWQKFTGEANDPDPKPVILAEDEFGALTLGMGVTTVVDSFLFERLSRILPGNMNLVNAGTNLAGLIASAVSRGFGSTEVMPIFAEWGGSAI